MVVIPNTTSLNVVYGKAPWGQWQPPTPGIHWHRITDFDRYNHKAVPFVKSFKIYSSAGDKYQKPIYKPSSATGQAYLIAEVELDGSISAEIRYSDLRVDSGNTELGDLYLTMLLLSADSGGVFHYAAQSERPIKDETAKATVTMMTSNIPGLASHASEVNMIVVCLSEKMTINEDHTYSGNTLPAGHWSLDINGANFQHIIVNNGMAQLGNGTDGGAAIIDYVNIFGRFTANPLPDSGILVSDDGALLELRDNSTRMLITWTGTEPPQHQMPDNIELVIDLMLSSVNGGLTKVFTYLIDISGDDDRVAVSSTGVAITGIFEFNIPTEDLQGAYTAKLTYSVGVKSQGASTIYSFRDADNHASPLRKEVTLPGTVTF